MKDSNVKVLDEKDNEFVALLNSVGITKNIAKALIMINNAKEATSREIELGASLRQPDVSIATKEMLRLGWISVTETKTDESKGRPKKIYTLVKSITDIVNDLEMTAATKLADTTATLNRLKALSKA
jgi:predicted transcriptional regulator